MQFEKEECENAVSVLSRAKQALKERSANRLKSLSNQLLHSTCFYQDAGNLTTTVLVYALSKMLERNDDHRIKNWDQMVKRILLHIDNAIASLKNNDPDGYANSMQKARKTLEGVSPTMQHYIKGVLHKAAINKGSRLHDHGLSLEQAAELLGISRWELTDYTGQKGTDTPLNRSINIKTRAKTAMEFFS